MEHEPKLEKEVFTFLDELRESGKISMQFATPYISERFSLPYREANRLLRLWAEGNRPKKKENSDKPPRF